MSDYINHTWVNSGALATEANDVAADTLSQDWFIELINKFGNPFSRSFIQDILFYLDEMPQLDEMLDDDEKRELIEKYFEASFADELDHSLLEVWRCK